MLKNTLKCSGELVTINDHQIHIYRQGKIDRPKLVFMAGSGTVAPVYDFKVLYEKLVNDFQIIVIEKFGYGYSDLVETPCDIDTLVSLQKQALNLMKEAGPYILAPHSMSGLEAIRWKQKYPSDVAAIIGLDMATPFTYSTWTEKEVAKRIKIMEIARKCKLHHFMNLWPQNQRCLTKDEINQLKQLSKRNAFNVCYSNEANEALKNSEIVDRAGKIECPTLLFSSNGKQTSKHWVKNQQEFASIMNAKLIVFDCGHYIHHFKSEEMCKEIIEFAAHLEK